MSPAATLDLLKQRSTQQQWKSWQAANESVVQAQSDYDEGMIAGTVEPVYRFDYGVLADGDVKLDAHRLNVGGYEVSLDLKNPF
ncbi:MAG: hypothetical protein ABJN62_02710 [Halioglobus sp.]